MSKRTFRIGGPEPLLDVQSFGRAGPRETGDKLTPAQLEQIRRTVTRTPEAVVKVLPRASNDLTEHDLPYTADIEILLLAKPP